MSETPKWKDRVPTLGDFIHRQKGAMKAKQKPKLIRGWADLGEEVCGDPNAFESQMARSLYKSTTCGISFYSPESKREVHLSGYCEGTDRECQTYVLTFPFGKDDFWAAVEAAEKDGCALWDETHGCEECGEEEDENGNRAVNKKCKNCGGDGIIL